MKEEELSRDELIKASAISLTLNTYDDIFSDFDPRPYSQRALSDDFLQEMRRATRDKTSGNIELRFLMPISKRVASEEITIKRRLREHFKKHYLQELEENKNIRKRGILMTLLGLIFIVTATSIASYSPDSFVYHLIVVVLEPAGWFTAWTGMDVLFYTAKEQKSQLDFYEKMSNAEAEFISY